MTIQDLLQETMTSIGSNRARTGLTILGIVIGIASVIIMLAIGNGAQASISSSISALGSNILTITGGGGGARTGGVNAGRSNQQTLTLADAKAIEDDLPLVKDVSPEVTSRSQVVANGNNTNTTIVGAVPAYETAHAVTMEDGSFISESQNRSGLRVAVLGPTTRDDLFGVGGDSIGQEIKIGATRFTVIGVTKSKGGSGFGNADDRIFIPLTTSLRYISGGEYVGSIAVTTENQEDVAQMQTEVTELLLDRHNKTIETIDFTIFNQADLASAAESITRIFTLLLSSVASISLIVGGIGIMNMMLTNVRERTREIGLRKAIGAKKKDISNQFLIESIIVTVIGGIIGVLFGIIVAFGISSLGLLQATVTMGPVLLAFGVSAAIGIIFGYYPAKKASELNPIEALRYE